MDRSRVLFGNTRASTDAPPGYRIAPNGVLAPAQYVVKLEEAQEVEANKSAKEESRQREIKEEAELARLQAQGPSGWLEPFVNAQPRHKLLDVADAVKLEANAMRARSDDDRTRAKELFKLIREKGQYRRLATLSESWRADLDRLEAAFPNFREVLGYLRRCFALSDAGDRSIQWNPIALDGPPGTGKSTFAEALAKLLQLPGRRINAEAMQEGSELTGSAEYWSNTRTGFIFDVLTQSDVATPLIFVDEVDKMNDGHGHNPASGLFALLEPSTARTFRDLSIPVLALDASRVLWVLTSNYFHRIPAPIKSRLQRFCIEAPTREQGRVIAGNVLRDILSQSKLQDFEPASPEVIDRVSDLAPRRMRIELHQALGNAVYAGRRRLTLDDLPASTRPKKPHSSRPQGISLWPRLAIFLDIRGVLQPDSAVGWEEYFSRLLTGEATKVANAETLEAVIGERNDIGLVLTASFREPPSPDQLKRVLGETLADLVLGCTFKTQAPRDLQVAAFVASHGLARWVAIDDQRISWPEEVRDRVLVTDSRKGLGCPKALARLKELLAQFGSH